MGTIPGFAPCRPYTLVGLGVLFIVFEVEVEDGVGVGVGVGGKLGVGGRLGSGLGDRLGEGLGAGLGENVALGRFAFGRAVGVGVTREQCVQGLAPI